MKICILPAVLIALSLLSGCGEGGGGGGKAAPGKVFLIRHCDYEMIDGGLTEKGRRQAMEIAAKLKPEKIDLILHSPVKRCEQTAKLVCEKLGKPERQAVDWLHEHSETAGEWQDEVGSGNVLMVTHSPVIRQITDKAKASKFGEVTRLK